tara:strand:+ start:695 stop:1726 length:1032 start_codon:yes stop_codon:yes gene_type:complete
MLDNLKEHIDNKYINVGIHDLDNNYRIYNYSQSTQFEKFWNKTTLSCRGLITYKDKIISRGPCKFFNYGEIDHPPIKEVIGVYEKVDGSLGIPYEFNGNVYLSTRGSFSSNQAKKGTKILNEDYDEFLSTTINDLLDDEITPIFEIIYPENQIVVNYGSTEELVFIGTIDNKTGLIDFETHRKEFQKLCTVVKKYTMDDKIPEKTEGFVVQFKNGTCAKIKSDWYINLHRLVANRDFYRTVLISLIENNDMRWIEDIPDEFYREIAHNLKKVETYINSETKRLKELLDTILKEYKTDKDIALKIKEISKDMPLLFILWRKGNKKLKETLLKNLLDKYKKSKDN